MGAAVPVAVAAIESEIRGEGDKMAVEEGVDENEDWREEATESLAFGEDRSLLKWSAAM